VGDARFVYIDGKIPPQHLAIKTFAFHSIIGWPATAD